MDRINDTELINSMISPVVRESEIFMGTNERTTKVWSLSLGSDTTIIARLLFSALRQLDLKDVDVIFVEAIDQDVGDTAAAVMNRLRKAAENEVVVI